jgi:hypothetical protein
MISQALAPAIAVGFIDDIQFAPHLVPCRMIELELQKASAKVIIDP